ncbi:winged helix-turn-helix domain-containing protein [Pseudoduganella lutea]|nr:winged helix-turn-helix domain-containing protein [Pseudoduganella lutea]
MRPEWPAAGALLHVGPYELWPAARRLRLHGKPVPLTPRALDVLVALVRHHPGMMSKNDLLAMVWPGLVVEENNLQVQVSLLRKLLGRNAIATVPGHGYRLALPVGVGEAAAAALPSTAPGALLGRAGDLAELGDVLRHHRLTSLLGAGGVGKSALARHAAAAAGPPVAWADMAECAGSGDVLEAVARGMGVDGGAVDTLARHAGSQPCVLVLDNVDRVARETAALAQELLARLPALRLLVTTQVRLHVPEEQVYRLMPLAIPPAGCALAEALDYGALALLQARAQGHDHRFTLTEATLPDAIALCRELDGLPLALELAAARIPALGVAGLLRRLGDRLPLLAKSTGTGPARQRSLHDTLEWSYDLLAPAAQALWCDTAALPTWFSLEELMARRGGDEAATLDLLGTLVDSALLRFDAGHAPGYTMAPSHRAFALRKRADIAHTSPPTT